MASCATTPSAHQSVNRPPTFTEGKLSTLEKNARMKKKKKNRKRKSENERNASACAAGEKTKELEKGAGGIEEMLTRMFKESFKKNGRYKKIRS
jgi:hypothetical protein